MGPRLKITAILALLLMSAALRADPPDSTHQNRVAVIWQANPDPVMNGPAQYHAREIAKGFGIPDDKEHIAFVGPGQMYPELVTNLVRKLQDLKSAEASGDPVLDLYVVSHGVVGSIDHGNDFTSYAQLFTSLRLAIARTGFARPLKLNLIVNTCFAGSCEMPASTAFQSLRPEPEVFIYGATSGGTFANVSRTEGFDHDSHLQEFQHLISAMQKSGRNPGLAKDWLEPEKFFALYRLFALPIAAEEASTSHQGAYDAPIAVSFPPQTQMYSTWMTPAVLDELDQLGKLFPVARRIHDYYSDRLKLTSSDYSNEANLVAALKTGKWTPRQLVKELPFGRAYADRLISVFRWALLDSQVPTSTKYRVLETLIAWKAKRPDLAPVFRSVLESLPPDVAESIRPLWHRELRRYLDLMKDDNREMGRAFDSHPKEPAMAYRRAIDTFETDPGLTTALDLGLSCGLASNRSVDVLDSMYRVIGILNQRHMQSGTGNIQRIDALRREAGRRKLRQNRVWSAPVLPTCHQIRAPVRTGRS